MKKVKVKPMSEWDNLSIDAYKAKQAGMSYGKYVAIYHPAAPVMVPSCVQKICPICGREFLAKNKKKIYCSEACSEKAKRLREAEKNQ